MSTRALTSVVSAVKGALGYDLASNRLWCQNVVQPTGKDELYTYDGLNQLLTFQRGTLNTGHTGLVGPAAWEEDSIRRNTSSMRCLPASRASKSWV